MVTYFPKLVGYLKVFRKDKPKTKDLLHMIAEFKEEFDEGASYSNYVDYNRAKHKYILMRWNEWEMGRKSKKFKLVWGNYEDEELGIWY